MDKFEQWFINQDFYTNMRFIHGDALFIKDGDVYRVLPVQMVWEAWQSRQAEVNQLERKLKFSEALRNNQFEHLQSVAEQRNSAQQVDRNLKTEIDEKDKRITNQKDFIEIALITLNHLKENAVTHRDYGHECNWVRSFNDLIKLASDAEDSLNEALRGNDA